MVRLAFVPSSLLWAGSLLFGGCGSTAQLRAIDSQGTPVALHQERHGWTTVIDLQDISGTGELVLKPASKNDWPSRLALRITPGAVHGLIVRTEAGLLFTPVADTEPTPREVLLQPSLYTHASQITLRWQ
jgi:hypothetical protein